MHRNLIQHQLLCTLGLRGSLAQYMRNDNVNISSAVRDAAIAFALGVTFPVNYLPALQIPTSRLKTFLSGWSFDFKAHAAQGLCVWLCMIRALAAKTCDDIQLCKWVVDELGTIEMLDAFGSRLRDLGRVK